MSHEQGSHKLIHGPFPPLLLDRAIPRPHPPVYPQLFCLADGKSRQPTLYTTHHYAAEFDSTWHHSIPAGLRRIIPSMIITGTVITKQQCPGTGLQRSFQAFSEKVACHWPQPGQG
jgi:hypothetical protein